MSDSHIKLLAAPPISILPVSLATMPYAPVNKDGAVMYYDDSGIPGDSTTYTTVILVHGLVFHGGSYGSPLNLGRF